MRVALPYGTTRIFVDVDEQEAAWDVIKTKSSKVLTNPRKNFIESCQRPIASEPLRDIIKSTDRVVIVTCDGTRPFPNKLILPWLLEELHIPDDKVTVLLGNGTHRENTPAEISAMFGDDIVRRIRIVNHICTEEKENRFIGVTKTKGRVSLNRAYVEADKRILLGFIEPHFFAGFSGGAKGIVPGIAALDTIMHTHRSDLIAHPKSSWGEIGQNPIHNEIDDMVSMCPPDFLVNVTLNSEKKITDFFCGNYIKAHLAGCIEVGKSSIVDVDNQYSLIITTNGGYPLDQNLYQTVKGISSAVRILEPGGTIIVASECRDGIPSHGRFSELMSQGSTPAEILNFIDHLPLPVVDQWQAQILSRILQQAEVRLFSSLLPEDVRLCHLYPIKDIQAEIEKCVHLNERSFRAAILPDGPYVIPGIVTK